MISKERILEAARTLYSVYGLHSVTMDDLAVECGVSKRTIYNSFRHKDEIVFTLTKDFISRERVKLQKIVASSKNPVENLTSLLEGVQNIYKLLTPAVELDLDKHFPNAWSLIQNFKQEVASDFIQPCMEQGIKKDYFRKDLSMGLYSELISKLAKISTRKNEFTGDIDSAHLCIAIRNFILSGLVTLKGWVLINDSVLDNHGRVHLRHSFFPEKNTILGDLLKSND